MNSFGNRKFHAANEKAQHALKVPFFSFPFTFWVVGRGEEDFFSFFPLFPTCSHSSSQWVLNMFPRFSTCSPKVFPIAQQVNRQGVLKNGYQSKPKIMASQFQEQNFHATNDKLCQSVKGALILSCKGGFFFPHKLCLVSRVDCSLIIHCISHHPPRVVHACKSDDVQVLFSTFWRTSCPSRLCQVYPSRVSFVKALHWQNQGCGVSISLGKHTWQHPRGPATNGPFPGVRLKVELALATKNLSCNVAISRAKQSSLCILYTEKDCSPWGWEKGEVQLCLCMTIL